VIAKVVVLAFLVASSSSAFAFMRVTPLRGHALDSRSESFIPAAAVAPAPGGRLLVMDWRNGSVWSVDPSAGTSASAVSLPSGLRGVAAIGGSSGHAVLAAAREGVFVMSPDGKLRARLDSMQLHPYVASAVIGDALFGIGSGAAAGSDRRKIATGCLLFRVDLRRDGAEPEALICEDEFADPFARALYPTGALLPSRDGKRLYAVWERLPILWVVGADGGVVAARELAWAEDRAPAPTAEARSRILSHRGAFYAHRTRYRWVQGLLHGPGDSVAVLFREPASRENRFTIDLYDRDGRLLSAREPVDLGLRSPRAHARTVTTSRGEQFIVVNEPNDTFDGVREQRLFRIDLAGHAPKSAPVKR
jgi:hypothetical protein